MTPVFCADIGGSFIKFGLSERPGHVVELERVETPGDDWNALCSALGGLLARHASSAGQGAGLALSIAGLVDPQTGKAFSANIPCISGRLLAAELAEHLGCAVVAANDADCLTLAEAHDGAGRDHPIVFCAIMGTGIGGGLAVDGRLVRGTGGLTGEWGHGPIVNTTVELSGERLYVPRLACGCGQTGCADTIGGARGIERLDRFLHQRDATSHDILDQWQAGDGEAARTVALWLELIADPLALAVNITGASIVPVGGGLASVSPLIAVLDQAVRGRVLNHRDQPLVVPALHLQDGGLVGASVLARQGR